MLNRRPADGFTIGTTRMTSAAEVAEHTEQAQVLYESGVWSGLSPRERGAVLLRLAALMARDAEMLAQFDSEDAGKPIQECRENDVPAAIESIRWFAEGIDKRTSAVSGIGADVLSFSEWEPFGVVAAILPWNYPLAMAAWKVGPALAVGNCLILKPAEMTPRSTMHLVALAEEAGVPVGVIRALPGRGDVVGEALSRDSRIGAISFTGSTATGRKVLTAAAESNLKRVSLEMGGKSAQILLDDALEYSDALIANMIDAAFLTSGQNCTAGSRILVAREILEPVVERFVRAAEALVVGDPSDHATDLGPVVSDAAADRILSAIREAVAAGARIETGGHELDRLPGGRYIPPTVLTDVPKDESILRTELFGPVVTVQPFDSIDEAIALANGSDFGLAASVWSKNIDRALGVARRLHVGLVSINSYSEGDMTVPFAGWKQSGFGGAEKSFVAFEQWSRRKSVWVQLHPESGDRLTTHD